MSSFDRKLLAETRKQTGATDANAIPNSKIQEEIDAGKAAISEDVRKKLDNGEILEFEEGASTEALRHYVYLRVFDEIQSSGPGNGPPDHVRVPVSVVHIRQLDFEDPQMNFWRDRLISSLRGI